MRTFFHGNMKRSLKPYTLLVSILTVVELYFAFGRIYFEAGYIASLANPTNVYVEELIPLFGLVFTSTFGWGVIGVSSKTECPKCGQKFMFTRKRRRMIGQGTHQGYEVTNYKSDWSCDNCGYKEKNRSEIDERQIPPAEDA